MHESTSSPTTVTRRSLLRAGVLTAGAAALVAACGSSETGEVASVGNGAPTPDLETGTVNNATRLRTAASIENTIANAYAAVLEMGLLAGDSALYPKLGDQTDTVTLFAEHHVAAAASYNELAVAAGGAPWECGNPRFDSVFVEVIMARITEGVEATDVAPAIPPSDDPVRDVATMVHALESLSAANAQVLVGQLTEAPLRQAAMQVGVRSGRQAALMALRINPGGYVPGEVTEQDGLPIPVAVPTPFGSVGSILWVGGAGDENGVRMRATFETPSLNSMVYDFTEYGECGPAEG